MRRTRAFFPTLPFILYFLAAAPLAVALQAPDADVLALRTQLDEALGRTTNAALDERIKSELTANYRQARQYLDNLAKWKSREKELIELYGDAKSLKDLRSELQSLEREFGKELSVSLSEATLRAELVKCEQSIASSKEGILKLELEPKRRAERLLKLSDEIEAAKKALLEIENSEAALPKMRNQEQESYSLLLKAQRIYLLGQLQSCEFELDIYRTKADFIGLRRDLLLRIQLLKEQRQAKINTVLESRRERDFASAFATTAKALRAIGASNELIKSIADDNTALAQQRMGTNGLLERIAIAQELQFTLKATLDKIRQDFRSLQERVQVAGVTPAIGMFLRRQKSLFPDIKTQGRDQLKRQEEINAVQLELFDIEQRRTELGGLRASVETVRADGTRVAMTKQENELMRELLDSRQRYINALLKDYNNYFMLLVDLDSLDDQIKHEVKTFSSYINEHIFWVPSSLPFAPSTAIHSVQAMAWLLDGNQIQALGSTLWKTSRDNALWIALFAMGCAILLWAGYYLPHKIDSIPDSPLRGEHGLISHAREWLFSIARAAPIPATLYFFGWLLQQSIGNTDFVETIGRSLCGAALLTAPLYFFSQIFRSGGLASKHFHWPLEVNEAFRSSTRLLLIGFGGAAFVLCLVEYQSHEIHQDALGRLLLLALCALVVFFGHRLFPKTIVGYALRTLSGGKWQKPALAWRLWTIGIPITLGVLTYRGFYYSALQMSWRLVVSMYVVGAVLILRDYLVRWARMNKSTLLSAAAHWQQEAPPPAPMPQRRSKVAHGASSMLTPVSHPERKLSERFLVVVLLLGLFLGLRIVWQDIIPAFNAFNHVELWNVAKQEEHISTLVDGTKEIQVLNRLIPITLADCAWVLLIMALALVIRRNIPLFLDATLLKRYRFDSGQRYSAIILTQYALLCAAFLISAGYLGVSWGKIQWLAAAFGVGLGFGLQEIFANFISGLILLIERPVRIGDTVTIGNTTGKITNINIRSTTILDFDYKELLIPNKEFITSQLVNWSLTDTTIRVVIRLGIAYEADPDETRSLLLDIAKAHPLVIAEPAPAVYIEDFGDNAVGFSLRVFVSHYDDFLQVRHDLSVAILNKFKAANIEIPLPQRVVRNK